MAVSMDSIHTVFSEFHAFDVKLLILVLEAYIFIDLSYPSAWRIIRSEEERERVIKAKLVEGTVGIVDLQLLLCSITITIPLKGF